MPVVLPQVELLADRKRVPAAARFGLAEFDRTGLETLCSLPGFQALLTRLPCLSADCPAGLVETWKSAGGGVPGVADIETIDRFWPPVLRADARWVAGDWYLAPPEKPTQNQLASRAMALRLMQLVAGDAETYELEAVFRQDPSLSYQLLRLVNSPGVGIGRRVTSFSQAIVILGRQHLRRWLNLLLFAARKEDPRAAMLLARAAVRARRLELIEKARGGDRAAQDRAFISGMFSLLGVLFGLPLEEVLRPLNLGPEMEAALCRLEGEAGVRLRFATRLETAAGQRSGDFADALAALDLGVGTVADLSLEAMAWTIDVVRENPGETHA